MSEAPKIQFKDVALHYASRGWSVFPIKPKDKKPLGQIVPHGCKDATKDETKIGDYWNPVPSANVGIATGTPSGFFVLDVDAKGLDNFKQLIQDIGNFRGTLTAETPGGGFHYLYKMPEGKHIANSQGLIAPGIDVRGTGGYIVAPPSVHPNGNTYRWMNNKEIVEAPEGLVRLITTSKKEEHRVVDGEMIEHGSQHETLFYMACNMRGSGFGEAAIFNALWEENITRCEKPGPEKNIRELAKSVCKYERGNENMHTFIARVMKKELSEEKAEEYVKTEQDKKKEQLDKIIGGGFTAAELSEMELPPIKWAIPDILPEGATLMVGKPKTGKSFFALNLATAVASGGRALGKIPVDQGRVLFLQLEGSKKGLKSRQDPLLQGAKGSPLLHFYPEWQTIQDGGLKRLKAWLSYYKDTSLVIIDTFKVIRGNTSNSKSLYDQDYNSLKPFAEIAEQYDVAILLIHHTNKMNDVEDPFDLASGSTGLMASVDTGMVLRRNPNHEGVDLFIRGRETEEVEYTLKFDPRLKTWIHQGDAEEFEKNSTKHKVLHVINSLDFDETIGPKEMAKRSDISYDVAAQTLKRLVEDGLVVRAGRGNYKQHPVNSVNFVKNGEMSTKKDTENSPEVDSVKTVSTSLSTSKTPHTSQNQRNDPQVDKVDRVDSRLSEDDECPF